MVLVCMQLLLGLFAIQYFILKPFNEKNKAELENNPENDEIKKSEIKSKDKTDKTKNLLLIL